MTPIPPFALRPIPAIHFGPGRVGGIVDDARTVGDRHKPVAVVVDRLLLDLGLAACVIAPLTAAGAEVVVFADVAGDPKQAQVDAAIALVRAHDAGLVICLGGGAAMDIGKIAATIARAGDSVAAFLPEDAQLPAERVPKICIPTTAGTGSELSSTNIFSNPAGRKVWIWGTETKPEHVILDPELTVSLPPALTAATGLDAFVHALEACTNRRRHPAGDLYAHQALRLIAASLETAVLEPTNLGARGQMLLGSAYAGIAIDNCSAAMAHNISHALAALGPVHHGLATGLALEMLLPWHVETDTGPFAAAAAACGLADAASLPGWYADLMNRCQVERKLPADFQDVSVDDLAREMRAPETSYQIDSTVRPVTDADIDRFAARMMALA